MVVKLLPAALILAAAGLIFWRSSAPAVSSPQASPNGASTDDVQIDYQNGIKAIVTYLPAESSKLATFLIEISSVGPDISGYDLSKNVVLADSNIDPLPTTEIKIDSRTTRSIRAKALFAKFPGNHFHFLLNNLGGIHNRVLHFYHAI